MIKKLALAAVCAFGLASPTFAASIQIANAEAIFEVEENRFEVFMTITNTGASADTLYAVKSKLAKSSRLNVSSIEDEHRLEAHGKDAVQTTALSVEPGHPLTLSEKGAHIVLNDVKTQVKEGETFTLKLFFENAGPVKVKVLVKQEHNEGNEEGHKDKEEHKEGS